MATALTQKRIGILAGLLVADTLRSSQGGLLLLVSLLAGRCFLGSYLPAGGLFSIPLGLSLVKTHHTSLKNIVPRGTYPSLMKEGPSCPVRKSEATTELQP